ncbi:MAG: alcohol dehydrogenase catalytic domain-containing protein [Alphaproteobacteria bacterium]|jgi:(R,R)-butanediol dehydrogenase/meso-butanediol dehydrogenase/diacetyl reductase|nr:alcohol dehydrogenase catalytic domain-containing protein [Alphaproteobacteria bacterium]
MKAAVFKQAGQPLVVEDVAEPEPGPAELILKVKACGICGTDLHWSEGTDPAAGWRRLDPGAVMGHEFSGEVVEIGRDIGDRYKVGQRVVAQPFIACGHCPACLAGRAYRCPEVKNRAGPAVTGAYAEFTRIGVHETLALPEAVSFQEGALVEPLAVGLNAVKRARLEAGDAVLIVGAGPVGLSVALWCRFFGARHIVVSDLVSARAERAAEFGATAAIDASREEVIGRFEQIAGGSPRVIFDCVGVPGSLQLSIDYAPNNAHVMVVGLCMAQDSFFPAKAIVKELDLTFCFVYSLADFQMVVEMLGQERLPAKALVTDCVGFDAFPTAFEALKTPGEQIKVMLQPD